MPDDDHSSLPAISRPIKRGPPAPATDIASRRGRPRDEDLTRRLLDSTLDLLADRGFDRLNADGLAARTGAGKAGVYRRWPDITEAAVAALATCTLIPPAPDTGSLRGDLGMLLHCLTHPLTRDERAAAALIGQARHDHRIQRALDEAVVAPLASALTATTDRHTDRGHPVDPSRGASLVL